MDFIDFIRTPWPWFVAGPLIGLMVPLLLLIDNKHFGISSTLRDFCAYAVPKPVDYFRYDLSAHRWRNIFVFGIFMGGLIVYFFLSSKENIDISTNTVEDLSRLGITDYTGLAPREIFNWPGLFSFKGFIFIVFGGFLVGFGTRWADGCTSGHAIMGLSLLSPASLIAVIGFFTGGLIATHLLFPLILV